MVRTLLLLAVLAAPTAAQPKPEREIPLDWKSSKTTPYFEASWLAFSPDGKYLAVRYPAPGADKLLAFDPATGAIKHASVLPAAVARLGLPAAAFAPKGSRVMFAKEGGAVARELDPATASPVSHRPAVPLPGTPTLWPADDQSGLSLTVPDEAKGLSAILTLLKYDIGRRVPVPTPVTIEVDLAEVHAAVLDPDRKRLAVSGTKDPDKPTQTRPVEVWEVDPPKKVHTLPGHDGQAFALAFSADGQRLATGGAEGVVKVWDPATGKELLAVKGPEYTVSAVAFSPDGKRLAAATYDGKGKPNLWLADAVGGAVLGSVSADPAGLRQVCWSPDGKRLATVGTEAVVRLWTTDALLKVGK